MRDLDHWKDKVELQLDGRQIFFLFFGSALCACLIFVVGVMVGKRIEARAIERAQAPASDPLAALDELGNAEEGLTFHSALVEKDKAEKADKKEARKPEKEKAEASKEGAAKEGKGEKGELVVQMDDAEQQAGARPADKQVQAAAPAVEKKPAQGQAAAPAAEKKPAQAAQPAAAKEPKADPAKAKGHFTLQLSAFATKGEAVEFMRKLRDGGYKPFMVESMVPGKGLMYRVRLGDFTTRDSALSAKTDFERKQKIVAYVAKL